jgi:trimeric autotransporter adhesin
MISHGTWASSTFSDGRFERPTAENPVTFVTPIVVSIDFFIPSATVSYCFRIYQCMTRTAAIPDEQRPGQIQTADGSAKMPTLSSKHSRTMKTKLKYIAICYLLSAICVNALAQGTAFTYQGRLNDGANPAGGIYDLRFAIYDSLNAGTQQGSLLTNSATAVSNGLFTAALDFGNQFPGANRWLEIGVRTNGGGSFFTLSPRQALTPAPYAITAASVVSGGLTAGTYGSAVTFNNANNSFSGAFSGNGANVTNVNATKLGGVAVAGFWQTGGNLGTFPGANILGSLDNQPLELWVNGLRALKVMPGTNTANLIGGSGNNAIDPGVTGAVIAGGGGGPVNGQYYFNNIHANYSSIGGGSGNTASNIFSSVAGGLRNTASGPYSTVSGGNLNAANGNLSTVPGGFINTASGDYSAVGGGYHNSASGPGSIVGGGGYDGSSFLGNTASGEAATVSGGVANTANGSWSTVGGGYGNTTYNSSATVGGGYGNTSFYSYSTVSGGYSNSANAYGAAVGGGNYNTASQFVSTVAGGYENVASGLGSFVGGGGSDGENFAGNMANGKASSICGGLANVANGDFSTIPGGFNCVANGFASFAAGSGAVAYDDGCFVWSDGNTPDGFFFSSAPNQFLIHATGGVGIGTGAPETPLHISDFHGITLGKSATGGGFTALRIDLSAAANGYSELQAISQAGSSYGNLILQANGGNVGIGTTTPTSKLTVNGNILATGTITGSSDRNVKEHFSPVSARDVLEKVSALPISEWNYKADNETLRHIGPMAQDFYATFNVGMDDKHISMVDADGVALAAIQGLNDKLESGKRKAETQMEELKTENAELKARLEKLEHLVSERK